LFIVLGPRELNEIKYAKKRIYHLFLVWIEKSIPRASCSKAVTRLAIDAALSPQDGFSHPQQEHMKDTYNYYTQKQINVTKSRCKVILGYPGVIPLATSTPGTTS